MVYQLFPGLRREDHSIRDDRKLGSQGEPIILKPNPKRRRRLKAHKVAALGRRKKILQKSALLVWVIAILSWLVFAATVYAIFIGGIISILRGIGVTFVFLFIANAVLVAVLTDLNATSNRLAYLNKTKDAQT